MSFRVIVNKKVVEEAGSTSSIAISNEKIAFEDDTINASKSFVPGSIATYEGGRRRIMLLSLMHAPPEVNYRYC